MEQPRRQHSFRRKCPSKQLSGRRNDTPLHVAARAGDLAQLRQLLSDSPGGGAESVTVIDVEIPDHRRELLARQNELGETALYVAADNGQLDAVRELLKHCDAELAAVKTYTGSDALHVAAKHGHLEIVKELLGFGPGLAGTTDASCCTPLYSAATQGHLGVVNELLAVDGKLVQIARNNGKTALHSATRKGHLAVVKALLAKDPAIAARKDSKGQTALHMAVKGRSVEVVKELLSVNPAIINLVDKKGNTALHVTTRKGRHEIVRELLAYKGINLNVLNNSKETALDVAEKSPCIEFPSEIKDLLREGGAENAKNLSQPTERKELKQTVSDLKHDVHSQRMQTEKTQKRVSGIAKDLNKLHREGINNTVNSVTVVAVLIATIAFAAIFTLPGQYVQQIDKQSHSSGRSLGEANIARKLAFKVFLIFDSVGLFISLAVVVVQISLVAWERKAQRQVIFVINKLMWMACVCTSVAFVALGFIVVGHHAPWMAITVSIIGGTIMMATLVTMCYFVVKHRIRCKNRSQRRIGRSSRSRSYSWSVVSEISDSDMCNSGHEKIYAL